MGEDAQRAEKEEEVVAKWKQKRIEIYRLCPALPVASAAASERVARLLRESPHPLPDSAQPNPV